MTRIAYLCADPGIPFGGWKGASVHVREVVAALAEAGAEVLVIAASVAGEPDVPAGVTVEKIPAADTWSGRGTASTDASLADWLTARLERFAPVALYERLALHASAGAIAAARLAIRHIVELNAPLLEEARRYRDLPEPTRARRAESTTLSKADLVFAVSPPLAAYALTRGARQVEVMPNAVDVERFSLGGRGGDRPVAVFAGGLRPWHGVETIAQAWAMLGRDAPPLLVVGDGPDRDVLAGVASRITGQVAPGAVPALLAEADIGLAPYGRETPDYFSPLKLFEYLAAGLATIVGDLPGVTSVVDERSACIITAGDAHALAAEVARLQADPIQRRQLGYEGRRLVERAHRWSHRARRILEVAGEPASVSVAS